MNAIPPGPDSITASRLAYAAEAFYGVSFNRGAAVLEHAAETLPGVLCNLERTIGRLDGIM